MTAFVGYEMDLECSKCGKDLGGSAWVQHEEDEKEYAQEMCTACKRNAAWVEDIAKAVAVAVVKALREQQ